MKTFLQTMAHVFANKESQLHVVYFLDHNKTRSLRLSRSSVLIALAIAIFGVGAIVFIGLSFGHKAYQNYKLTAAVRDSKEKLLVYQLRYDGVWSEAYPGLEASGEPSVIYGDKGTPGFSQEKSVAALKEASSRTTTSSGKELTPPVPSPKKRPIADNKEAISKHAPSASFKLGLAKVQLGRHAGGYTINFDLTNHHRKKAKGLFWAKMTFLSGKDKVTVFSHAAASQIDKGAEPAASIPTFSVRNYRRCYLQIDPPSPTAIPLAAEIVISDRLGRIITKHKTDIPKNIADKSPGRQRAR